MSRLSDQSTPDSRPEELPRLAWVNGLVVPLEEASLSLTDAAVTHGVGVFETLLIHHRLTPFLEAHLKRLCESAQCLGLIATDQCAAMHDKARAVVAELVAAASPGGTYRLRITLSAGGRSLLGPPDAASAANLFATLEPRPPVGNRPQNVQLMLTESRLPTGDPASGHKTLQYFSRLLIRQQAQKLGAFDAVVLDADGFLASGCVSNLLWVKDGRVETPLARDTCRQAPVRPGVTREFCIRFLASQGVSVALGRFPPQRLREADAAFLCSEGLGVAHVQSLLEQQHSSAQPSRDYKVSDIADQLFRQWRRLLIT